MAIVVLQSPRMVAALGMQLVFRASCLKNEPWTVTVSTAPEKSAATHLIGISNPNFRDMPFLVTSGVYCSLAAIIAPRRHFDVPPCSFH